MAICSFIGHRDVFDADIQSRMQAVVDELTVKYETIEFLIYSGGDLSRVFLLAALKAKTNYPQKVTISFVSLHTEIGEMNNQDQAYLYISDKHIIPKIHASKKTDSIIEHKKTLQWIIQESTHIISYFYSALYDPDSQLIKCSKAIEINLTTHETESAISAVVSSLSEKEQIVYQKMNEGCTLKEAGGAVGVGGERARQILQHGCREVRTELRQRCNRALTAEQKQHTRTCGLFSLGEATYDSLTCFKRIMDFLIPAYGVSNICMEKSYVRSGFMFALTDPSFPFTSLRKMHITALIGGSSCLSEKDNDPETIEAMYCPPCNAVGYVNRVDLENAAYDFDVIADMIERMDFCICNLSTTP